MDALPAARARAPAIPVGVYRAGGIDSPIYLDADFLLGPEAAHLNITGVSGLATKTSAVEWLLASIFAHFPEQQGIGRRGLLQREGPDLCFLDQPGELDDDRPRACTSGSASRASRSSSVRYFAPYKANG